MSAGHDDSEVMNIVPRLEEVSEDIFAYIQPDGTWWINNTGVVVGKHGVISIDTCATEARTRAYRESISKKTDLPVRVVVNTHHHGDHTFGNYLFDGSAIVGHERTREQILRSGGLPSREDWPNVNWGDIKIEPPFLTFKDAISVYSDELRCEVFHVQHSAHTDNDSVVWIPERSLLFAGDLVFNGGTPFVLMGSVSGAIDVLDDLKELGATTVVPGHGDVCGPEIFDTVQDYLRFVLKLAKEGLEAGANPLDLALEADLGQWASLTDTERIVGNVYRAYADLSGEEMTQADIESARKGMVSFNGGRPLSCYA